MTGNAFGEAPVQADKLSLSGYRGRRLANSFVPGDPATGEMTSPEFEIVRDYIEFLIGGGRREGERGIELLVDGKSVHSATGDDSGRCAGRRGDVRPLKGWRGVCS